MKEGLVSNNLKENCDENSYQFFVNIGYVEELENYNGTQKIDEKLK